jgi:Na+/proline symporter
MDGMRQLLAAVCVAGVLVMAAGWVLRERKIRAEHWLWKRRRLRRARVMLGSGGTMSALSVVAYFIV